MYQDFAAAGWKTVGYSSHDEDWEAAFVAIGLGIDSLERHIVADKEDGVRFSILDG